MTASENQIVVYQLNETVRLDVELCLIGALSRDFGKTCCGFTKMGAHDIRLTKKDALSRRVEARV